VRKHFSIPRSMSTSGMFNSENSMGSYVCSLTFEDNGNTLAVGDSLGQIHITDVEKNKAISSSFAHTSRIGSLHWQESLLISGSRDKTVRLFDIRQNISHPVYSFAGHIQEICGLKLSPDNNFIASGGNDNQLLLWDIRRMKLLGSLGEHEAAVKALAWCPKQRSVLVSGAGTADRKLRIFDTAKCEQLAKIDTGSQVCNLIFDREGDALISTHGYSLNQMIVWNYSKNFDRLKKQDVIIAHKLRVLYLATSPCGKYIATGAGDETIRIWSLMNQKRVLQSGFETFGNRLLTMR
jgi:cell division cycle 20-like protein 1 (cofactor of APC complex)